MRAPMVLALASKSTSRSAWVRPLVEESTPLASRIQVSIETKLPTWGEYPGRGPRRFSCSSAPEEARDRGGIKPAASAATDPRTKLLRLEAGAVANRFRE